MSDTIGLVYRKRYNIVAPIQDLCHPFDTKKYGRIYNYQKEDYGIITESNKQKIWHPDFPSRETQSHDVSFWHLLWMNYSLYATKIAEMPICFLPGALTRLMLLNPVQYGTQGSIDAAMMAYDKGYAINQSGGYHHCHRSGGSGFCFQPDITQAISHLRKYLGVNKVMIIDLDAHQGNGHERDFQGDQNVYIIDFYNPYIFPGDTYAKGAIDVEFFVTHRIDDNAYISAMQKQIEPCILEFQPEFIQFNAGTDILEGDPLGNCSISQYGILRRDQLVFELAFKYKIPILMVQSGGYLQENAPCIAASIHNLFKKFGLPY